MPVRSKRLRRSSTKSTSHEAGGYHPERRQCVLRREELGLTRLLFSDLHIAASLSASGSIELAAATPTLKDSAQFVIRHIEDVVSDVDQYEIDEAPPGQETIETAKRLLESMAEVGYNNLPKTYVSVYYGELAVTWKTERNLVRLTFRPDASIELYRQANYKDSARGESILVADDDNKRVAQYIRWLGGDSDGDTSE